MTRKYPYYPAWDGGKTQPITTKALELLGKRYGVKSLGAYVNRDMRDKPGEKSVHSTGFACDFSYKDEAQARVIWDYLLKYSAELGVCELHWYRFGEFGAGYRCSRGEGKAGVKVYKNRAESAGVGGQWLHLELAEQDSAVWEAFFRAHKD
jgi:hypothetical protein